MRVREHWDDVYARKAPDEVSWYQPSLARSLRLIEELRLPPEAPIIDVGGGASTLVDDLLARGHTNVTVLDVSAKALEATGARLGSRAANVKWIAADITEVALTPAAYALWHDRAVFHFLVEDELRRRYVATCRSAVRPGGHILVATFGPGGPERCSGLPVRRYDAAALQAALGPDLHLVAEATESHVTPSGATQQFCYALFEVGGTLGHG
jgi:2-polyprenyl-3-methyl-5-hydroxy-6-metoxy-1,4-benzoquinol methylase